MHLHTVALWVSAGMVPKGLYILVNHRKNNPHHLIRKVNNAKGVDAALTEIEVAKSYAEYLI